MDRSIAKSERPEGRDGLENSARLSGQRNAFAWLIRRKRIWPRAQFTFLIWRWAMAAPQSWCLVILSLAPTITVVASEVRVLPS